jgi:hypothetical protein
VRSTAGATRRYSVGLVPKEFAPMVIFLTSELKNIEAAINHNADGFLELIAVAPDKPRDGMIRNADAGVLGASRGFYGYSNGAWRFLG